MSENNQFSIRMELVEDYLLGKLERQEGRWRIGKLDMVLQVEHPDRLPHLPTALEQFEDFCVVTQSIRTGIPVNVSVEDMQGNPLQ